ncbi:MAG TPA: hypothetical protein VGM02_12015 [Acidobacteriaceae bacterium]|jgi:hypothetical protein
MIALRSLRTRQKPHVLLLLACLLVLGRSAPAGAQKAAVPAHPAPQGNCTHPDPSTRPECPGAIAFLAKLQDALKRNDHAAVASMVSYPLLATDGGKRHIRSRAQLLAGFDQVFNPQVRAAILAATADDVWGNSKGFMIGRGVIWFDVVLPPHADLSAPDSWKKYPFKLITVNPVYP